MTTPISVQPDPVVYDAAPYFEELLARMSGAVAIDALLLALSEDGALLAARLAQHLPGRHDVARLYLPADGAVPEWPPETPESVRRRVEQATAVVLVDSVLWDGEDVARAVALLRAQQTVAPIELAVLVDRGGRTVPAAPTYCGGFLIVAVDTALRLAASADGLRFFEERA